MDIGDRYIEQIQTTVETMRRRCLAYYDQAVRAVVKIGTAYDRLREVAEPAFYDARDYTQNASLVRDGIDQLTKDEKNNLVELYLGISVLLIGLSCGQLAGAFVLPSLFETIFNPFIEFVLVFAIFVHSALSLRKTTAMDDVERRVLLFRMSLIEGALVGHLMGSRLTSLVPSTLFIHPLVFALLIDNELITTPFTSDRYVLFGAAAAISVHLAVFAASVPLGYISFAVVLLAAIHAAFGAGHFQVITANIRENIYNVGESQMAYVVAIFVVQIVLAVVFGTSPSQEKFTQKITTN